MHMTNTIRKSSQISTLSVTSPHACTNGSVSNAVRLGCFHTCHTTCLEENQNLCQLCQVLLVMKVEELTESTSMVVCFSLTLENLTSNDTSDDEDEIQPPVTISTTKDYNLYQSTEWKGFVEMELADVGISQPRLPHKPTQMPADIIPTKQRRCPLLKLSNSLPPEDNCLHSTTVLAPPLSGIQVKPTAMGNFTVWSFPFGCFTEYSQWSYREQRLHPDRTTAS